MNELALFAGAGGGILGGHLLGWRTVCAVEWEAYPASVLCARQNDGLLPSFPIWDDVQTFDGKPWQGIVDVVSGGFPCQDISAAGLGGELLEAEVQCGSTWLASFTKYDLSSSLWKTHQCSLLEDLELYSEIWPKWGSMRNGECLEQQMWAHLILEKEYGYVPNNENFFHTPNTTGLDGGSNSRKALKKRMEMWPTPVCQDSRHAISRHLDPNNKFWKSNLGEVVMSKEEPNTTGRLNPTWVEWLMGWPLEWTDLKPLEMDKYLEWQQSHGNY